MLYSTTLDETRKEVYSSIIGDLKVLTIKSIDRKNQSPEEIAKLEDQMHLLEFEQMAVLGDDEVARSIQDKVKKLYSPIIKKINEERRSKANL